MSKTSIQWTDHSLNPIRARDPATNAVGHVCQKISPGCANCYASGLQKRFNMPEFKGTGAPLNVVEPFLDESKLQEVLRRKKPTRYFWCDMTDLFGEWVPDGWINACFRIMLDTPQHTHQVLTKRPERMRKYVCDRWGVFDGKEYPLARNIWLGVSVEDQQRADERIPHLLRTPAAVRFLSVEPLLGLVDLWHVQFDRHTAMNVLEGCGTSSRGACGQSVPNAYCEKINWVIVGGESGHNARPCDVQWIRSLVHQCKVSLVPVFVKQLGVGNTGPYDAEEGEFPRCWKCGHFDFGPCSDGTLLCNACNAEWNRLRDSKGGDPAEWAADLRVREFPEVKP